MPVRATMLTKTQGFDEKEIEIQVLVETPRKIAITKACRRFPAHERPLATDAGAEPSPRREAPVSADELAAIVHEYQRVHEDHRRAPARSRVRRHLEVRLQDLRGRFERLLAEAPINDTDRRHWRERFERGATTSPPPPTEDVHPLLFRGRSESGSELRLGAAADGTIVASIDGTRVAVLDDADELRTTKPGFAFTLDGQRFRETFGATGASLDDLRDALRRGRGRRPPRKHLRLLIEDGLVARTLGLTPRGRRALGLDVAPARQIDRGL